LISRLISVIISIRNKGVKMKTFEEIKKKIEEHREELISRFKIKEIGIFGSYARGDQDETSDVDILVDYSDEHISLFDVLDVKYYFEELLGLNVDIVTREALKPVIGKHIMEEVVFV
jgi:predicted nucleotidyltransferase